MRIKLLIAIFFLALVNSAQAKDDDIAILEKISLEKEIGKFKASIFKESEIIKVNNGETIDFDSFIKIVKDNHPNIVSADLNRQMAKQKRIEAQGAFDPSINSSDFFNRFNSSSAIGKESEAFTSNTSLDFLTGYGAKLGIGAKFAQGDIKTPIKPTGEAGEYYIKAQIPLLRDAIYNSKNVKEKTSKLSETIANFIFFREQLYTLNEASESYWDWFANKKILDVETNLLNIVNGQVAFVQDQASAGNLPEISVVEARREAQKRKNKIAKALRKLQKSSLVVSKFTWQADGMPYAIPDKSQAPTEAPEPKALKTDDIELAKFHALKARPEFEAVNLSREISDLERKLAKNQMLPQIDAYLGSGFQAGDDNVSPTIEAGVNISLPLRVRTAGAQKRQAELKIKKFNLEERKLIQNVFLEIEDAASSIQTTYQRYLASKENYELSLKLEQGEKDRFDLGASTLFLVIRRQRARVEANIELIKTIADYQKALVNFNLVQGTLI